MTRVRALTIGLVGLVALVVAACGTSDAGTAAIPVAPTTSASFDPVAQCGSADATLGPDHNCVFPTTTTDTDAMRYRIDTAVQSDGTPLVLNPISGFHDAYDLINFQCQVQTLSDEKQVVGNPMMALLDQITQSNEEIYGNPFSPGQDAAMHVGIPLLCPQFTADLD